MHATGEGGAIVNLASINAKVPAKGMAAYCSAKAGVEMLTRCSGDGARPEGIRVAAIGPGLVETPLTEYAKLLPADRPRRTSTRSRWAGSGRPDDIASAALFLVSDDASWVSGETLYVDGAESTNGYPDLTEARRAE